MSDPISFWARRRAAVRAEEEAEALASEEARVAKASAELAERPDAEILAELKLPDPSQMQRGDDFSGFMAKEVPEHLRRQALRTLWRSNPVLACVDGLNEYDDDYRAAMLLQEPIKTAYQVGKGMLKHIEEMERKAEAQALGTAADQEDAVEVQDAQQIEEAPVEAPEVVLADMTEPVTDESVTPAPRRMRFRFEEATI